jgi:hypothetical protein
MITIEAFDKNTKKVLDTLALTDPFDGGSRERNAKEEREWSEKLAKKYPDTDIKYGAYFG